MSKKVVFDNSRNDAWDSIQWGIRLSIPSYPHIKEVVLTKFQKEDLINLYSLKKYVDYCAKFEEYFLITKHNNERYIRQRTLSDGESTQKN